MQLSGASKASTATHTVEGSASVIEDCSDDEEEGGSESPVPAFWQYSSVQLALCSDGNVYVEANRKRLEEKRVLQPVLLVLYLKPLSVRLG